MHFRIKNMLKSNRNHTYTKYFIYIFLLYINFKYNFFNKHVSNLTHYILKKNYNHKNYFKNKYNG